MKIINGIVCSIFGIMIATGLSIGFNSPHIAVGILLGFGFSGLGFWLGVGRGIGGDR